MTLGLLGRPFVRRLAAAVLLAGLCSGPARAQSADDSFDFGLIAVQSRATTLALWGPVLEGLSQRLGVRVTPHVAAHYADIVWGLRDGRDRIAWLGNKSAAEAVDNADGEVFARRIFADGSEGYHSLLIVAAGSPFASLDDLLGHARELTLGLGDRNSTSGFLLPAVELFAARGIDPRQAFRRVSGGSHEDNIEAVLSGRVDAAAVSGATLARYDRAHPGARARVRVLWRSAAIPSDPLVWRKDLPERTKDLVRTFFLTYGEPAPGKTAETVAQERATLRALNLARFVASDDRQLAAVRRIELYRVRLRIMDDPSLDDGERQRRLETIDAKLAAWGKAAPPDHP